MNFQKHRMLIGIPFLVIINFFVIKYTTLLFAEINEWYILIIALILGILKILPLIFESEKSTKLGRFLSKMMGVWSWVWMFLAMDVTAIYILDYVFTLPFWLILAILAIVPILTVYNYYHAHKLIIHDRVIELNNLAEDVNIVHFSDVHFGSIRHREIIKKIANGLKNLEDSCDLAIISGDLADGTSKVESDDFLALKDVNMPIIFTPGNHDFYPGIDDVFKACENAGIIILDNDNIEMNGLNIFGMTFSFGSHGPRNADNPLDIDKLVSSIKKDGSNIIIYHMPSNWEEFSKLGFDLQLSGHTHGGQFYPAIWICKTLFGYNKGLFKNDFGTIKDHYLHVTTGVGSMGYPMRWGTDSELVVLKLRQK
ncbi:MAG: metallophosphoesterase [Methanobacteriaceae archaeon]|nr:metallophosphoesterase [Methanobacteriaceae archaeon]